MFASDESCDLSYERLIFVIKKYGTIQEMKNIWEFLFYVGMIQISPLQDQWNYLSFTLKCLHFTVNPNP